MIYIAPHVIVQTVPVIKNYTVQCINGNYSLIDIQTN